MFTTQQFSDAGYDSTFYKNIVKVSQDEKDHVDFLTSALTGMHTILLDPIELVLRLTPTM